MRRQQNITATGGYALIDVMVDLALVAIMMAITLPTLIQQSGAVAAPTDTDRFETVAPATIHIQSIH